MWRPLAFLCQQRPATARRAAVAREAALGGWRVSFLEDVRVVVGELLARPHVANGFDPDATVLDDSVAVRIARVVYEPRCVAVHRRIDHDVVVDREQERVVALTSAVGIARIRFSRRESRARILDQAGTSRNATCRERAHSLDR